MSAAFRFALQALLNHAASLEHHCRSEAAVTANACARERERLRRLLTKCNVPVNLQALRLQVLHAEYLERTIAAQETVLRSSQAAQEAAHLRLREVATQRLALEKLKARRRRAHAAAQEAAEQRELDVANHP